MNFKRLALNLCRLVGVFFLLMAFLQFQDNFVSYAFVSLGISLLIFFFTFRGLIRNRKSLNDF
jgi:hypothetical protein